MAVFEEINKSGFSAYLHGYSAIDSWLNVKRPEGNSYILTNAGTADLAKIFEGLRYPGVNLADAALDSKNDSYSWYFRCADSFNENRPSFSILEFYRDCSSRVYYDPRGIYPELKEIRKTGKERLNLFSFFKEGINKNTGRIPALTDAALILAKYLIKENSDDLKKELSKTAELLGGLRECAIPCQEEQRLLLCELITSRNPGPGMELLKMCGYIDKYWPELAILEEADHSKEFHPEGNAWEHTLQTFRHRKCNEIPRAANLTLSLGLLLHDLGKPISASTVNHRYEGHAELGEIQARRFLERLGFSSVLIKDICFLVRNHMLPAALPRIPLYRTSQIMTSPLFPLLLELYRCDESSSFKGLHGYYESSAVYQQFLRDKRNPYRRNK